MIKYKGVCILYQCKGSVFPAACTIATLCGLVTGAVRWALDEGHLEGLVAHDGMRILRDNSVWSSFTFLVGFLVVFRTSQAYNRFWDGSCATNQMRAKWYDACSSIFAFTKASAVGKEATLKFQHLIVRLFSVLHALALADIEDSNKDRVEDVAAFKYELLDGASLDEDSLRALKTSDAKVEMMYQWMQQVVIEGMASGALVIPAPILARSFQELANGLHFFYAAINISQIPFPFPYAQMCECLLLMHWLVTPIVVAQYVQTPWWGALFTFIIVFVYWSLNAIAVEIENPFGMDANDIDACAMQDDMNRHLLLLLEPTTKATPHLSEKIRSSFISTGVFEARTFQGRESLFDLWENIDSDLGDVRRSARRKFGSLAASSRGASRGTRKAPKMVIQKTEDDDWYAGQRGHQECMIHHEAPPKESEDRADLYDFNPDDEAPLEPPMVSKLGTFGKSESNLSHWSRVSSMSHWPGGEFTIDENRGVIMDVWDDEDTPNSNRRGSLPALSVRRSALEAIAAPALRGGHSDAPHQLRGGHKRSLPPVGEVASMRDSGPTPVISLPDVTHVGLSFDADASPAGRQLVRTSIDSSSSSSRPRPSGMSSRAGGGSPRASSVVSFAVSDRTQRTSVASSGAGDRSPRASVVSSRADDGPPRASITSSRADGGPLRASVASSRAGDSSPRASAAPSRAGDSSPRASAASSRAGDSSPRASVVSFAGDHRPSRLLLAPPTVASLRQASPRGGSPRRGLSARSAEGPEHGGSESASRGI